MIPDHVAMPLSEIERVLREALSVPKEHQHQWSVNGSARTVGIGGGIELIRSVCPCGMVKFENLEKEKNP